MTITDEMLYAAAPDAAEIFLDSLPGRAECDHVFSDQFVERMQPLLRRTWHRRKWWRGVLIAAVVAALAFAIGVGASQKSDCQVYWSQNDGVLRYSVLLEHDTVMDFQKITLGYLPDGYELEQETTSKTNEAERYTLRYQKKDSDDYLIVTQSTQRQYTGMLLSGWEGSEVSIGKQTGLLMTYTKGVQYSLVWTDGPYIFTVSSSGLSREEVLKTAENIRW
jgi:hypothetical protein